MQLGTSSIEVVGRPPLISAIPTRAPTSSGFLALDEREQLCFRICLLTSLRPSAVIPNGAGRLFLPRSLPRKGRPADVRNLSSLPGGRPFSQWLPARAGQPARKYERDVLAVVAFGVLFVIVRACYRSTWRSAPAGPSTSKSSTRRRRQ